MAIFLIDTATGIVENILPTPPLEGWGLPGKSVVVAPSGAVGDRWDGTQVVSNAPPPPDFYAVAAEARYLAETSGIILDGVRVLTDRDSQGLINGAVSLAQINPATSIRFKTAVGVFVTLGATQIIGIGIAVGQHVQNCFAREADVAAEIAAGILTTPEAVRARFANLTLS